MNRLEVVQYNCGNSNGQATRALFDSFTQPLILVIQEPGWNRYTKSTYCPKLYQLAYEATPETKVCFMIRRDAGVTQWNRIQYGPNVAKLELRLRDRNISIINVYNPPGDRVRLSTWPAIQQALDQAQGQVILLGDFNAHHPKWGGVGTVCDQHAEHLLQATGTRGLQLLTEQGDITWRRGTRESVIDLAFAEQAISTRITYYGTMPQWALTRDHIPIRLLLDVASAVPRAENKRFALNKLDIRGLQADIEATPQETTLEDLQRTIKESLKKHCPTARPSKRARPEWSPAASELLVGSRRARRRYTATGNQEALWESYHLAGKLKQELRKNAKANWRRYMESLTQGKGKNNIWRMARWSKKTACEKHEDPHLPPLRQTTEDDLVYTDAQKDEILTAKFFPPPTSRRRACEEYTGDALNVPQEVTAEEANSLIAKLPSNKAPGPDRIPNEVLKQLSPTLDARVAYAISRVFAQGELPREMKESTTLALRKEGKKDYSLPGAYRPIALENTLAKLTEKALANRITDAAEEHHLLPWNQMGGRRDRSTHSAIGLITACVERAWQARPSCVVSMLSLDIAGAFDNVPHNTLLDILTKKGFPEWLVKTIQSFLSGRRTRIAYAGHESDWIDTETGIPQGSPLSPILFLFYISGLLESLDNRSDNTIGFGFIDDTNIIAWGPSEEHNCRRLNAVHRECEEWATNHGARFAPEKYQLIHFTKSRRPAGDPQATSIHIAGQEIRPEQKAIKVLGVWLDPKLTWKEHIAHAARKGLAASEAIARLATATWGPSTRNTRLLYIATVRPILLYGSQEWSTRIAQGSLPASRVDPLAKVQNRCLRGITGGYKRTPRAALEKETHIPPLDLTALTQARKSTLRTAYDPVERSIQETSARIWRSLRTRRQRPAELPRLTRERAQEEANTYIEEELTRQRTAREQQRPRRPGPPPSKEATLRKAADRDWKARWEKARVTPRGHNLPATWTNDWKLDRRTLYAGLSKAEATALFLLRTEVIGLNGWLAGIGVPGIDPLCSCGQHVETVRHVLLHCRKYEREELLQACGTQRVDEILSRPAAAKHAARWLVARGVLEHLKLAREIGEEDMSTYTHLKDCTEW